ncbi:Imm21 family immunity protein [Streptomyces sp. NBC_01431]|uniref:Imm21 family immunity protein n=1 Tax=Streptomyces sp. NBC_01431 TaxID=2903863 RepID=UPI002E364EE6|nr:Imm21 family immunity protein [Streptomyces sp. NBC_01431]
MDLSSRAVSHSSRRSAGWVESLAGPLIVVPVSVLAEWGGCSENWGEEPGSVEDYDRACAVEDWAGLLDVGSNGAQALVLADECPDGVTPSPRRARRARRAVRG